MPVRKIAVSMAPDLIAAARVDAARRGESLSGWLADAAARKLRRRRAREALVAFEGKHGAITERELEAIRKRWPG